MIPTRALGVSAGRLSAPSLRASSSDTPRRVNHGGAAWLKRHDYELRQPQDGAPSMQTDAVDESIKLEEAADAQMTGTTRSLGSRLLGLNVAARSSVALPAKSALRQLLPRRPVLPKTALLKA